MGGQRVETQQTRRTPETEHYVCTLHSCVYSSFGHSGLYNVWCYSLMETQQTHRRPETQLYSFVSIIHLQSTLFSTERYVQE